MTKRNLEWLAAALKSTRPTEPGYVPGALKAYAQWNVDVDAIASVCEHSNPRFDRERFIETCGGLL